ncbi:MAG: transcription antitermination factor NusB [Polyangiaceae bacterium]|nr:transcription antitermination factor NusB [Polyangiaceae bacterium]
MGARTSGRQAALQMLFGVDGSPSVSAEKTIRTFWREFEADPEGRPYADSLVRGVLANLQRVDEVIRMSSTNWRLERMARVDRNLLRIAAYELLELPSVPRAVILDEAIEMAKVFGSEDSGSFVNRVLDRVAEETGRVNTD